MLPIHHTRLRSSICRRALSTTAGLAALLLLACSSSPTEMEMETVAFSTVVKNSHSGILEPRQEVIGDSGRWAAAWSEIHAGLHPVPPLPSVPFSQRMVVLAAIGERPDGCYQTDVTAIRTGSGRLEVSIVESQSVGCGCTQALTHPVHVVELDRLQATPHFDVSQRTVSCG